MLRTEGFGSRVLNRITDGRTYEIIVSGSDVAGNAGSATVIVTVAHDQGK